MNVLLIFKPCALTLSLSARFFHSDKNDIVIFGYVVFSALFPGCLSVISAKAKPSTHSFCTTRYTGIRITETVEESSAFMRGRQATCGPPYYHTSFLLLSTIPAAVLCYESLIHTFNQSIRLFLHDTGCYQSMEKTCKLFSTYLQSNYAYFLTHMIQSINKKCKLTLVQ